MSEPISSSSINRWHFIVSFIGVLVALAGLIPMIMALGVSNILIDDGGVEPGEGAIMESWDAWAFSPLFVSLALIGLAGLGVQLCLIPKHHNPKYAITVFIAISMSLFIAMFIHGWFFHDIHLR